MVLESDPADLATLEAGIQELLTHADTEDQRSLTAKLAALVPGYVDGGPSAARRPRRTQRMLVVEPDPYIRKTLKRILQAWYIVLEAENERETMQHVGHSAPHMVILNSHLPRTNIKKLYEKIKHHAVPSGDHTPETEAKDVSASGSGLSFTISPLTLPHY